MKLQLLSLVCLFALSSALAAKRPARLESSLSSSSRINSFGLAARDDEEFGICSDGWCYLCNERCVTDEDCNDDDDDDDDDDYEYCIRGFCCEFKNKRCGKERYCEDDDEGDDK